MLARIKELGAPIEELKNKEVSETTKPIDGSRDNCRARECEMGNLVADAILDRVKDQGVTIVFQNGGGLRASIDQGVVTMGEVLTVLPFQNTLATFQLSGKDIVASLEHGVSAIEDRICAITAAMPSGTGLDKFAEKFPDRMFDVGIAEQHAVTFAAGLAAQGYRPFCAIYSTFLQRAYDQVVHDVAIQNLPVRFGMDRAGLVGADGATHAGSFDLAYLCTLPNFVVMAAADEVELVHMVHTMALHDSSPIAVRYPRGEGRGLPLPATPERLEIGKGRIVKQGSKVAILSLGTRLEEAEKAAEQLEAKGLSTTVADLRFAKPLDEELIRRLLTTHEVAVTVEEAAVGGIGAHVLTLASDAGLVDGGLKIRTMRLPDRFQDHDKPEKQYDEAGLNAPQIVETVLKALRVNSAGVEEVRA